MTVQNFTNQVTAAVTTQSATPNQSQGALRGMPTPQEFMERVMPWPGPQGSGWVNLHWTKKVLADNRPRWRGQPFKSADELVNMAQRLAMNEEKASDIFYCLSVQSQCDTFTMKDGRSFPVAKRDTKLATLLKAIWLDVDVKEPPKGYATVTEAKKAILDFCDAMKIPYPNAWVESGGGVHAYWISDTPLSVQDWRPYAEGLKQMALDHGLRCDAGVTSDVVRILRMPGTFNRKIAGQPRLCKVAALAARDYNFATELAMIKAKGDTVTVAVTKEDAPPFDMSQFVGGMPPGLAAALKDEMESGRGKFTGIDPSHSDLPLTVANVERECGHFADCRANHGKGQPQPLWALTLLAASFFEDPEKLAHEYSSGYPSYTPEETQAKYEEKLRYKAQKGLGWPKCKSFEDAGCTACASCKWKGKIKSPLNLALPSQSQGLPASIGQVQQQTTLSVEAIRTLRAQGAGIEELMAAMNETFAVVRYRGEILVADTTGKDIIFMTEQDFHKMFANLIFFDPKTVASNLQEMKQRIGTVGSAITSMSSADFEKMFADLIVIIQNPTKVSKRWFNWSGRRQYFGRGIAFEPGGPLEEKHDMLNLWRGFGVDPKPGDWSLMRKHILNVVCSGDQGHYEYLVKWMAYGVQHLNEPVGVAIALRGAQGAGKGVVARTYGSLFGRHFAHIANGDQLTGRFNASFATSCAVFLDEALWAGDKKGEGVLKALITEPRLQLEAKFRDPIMVDNRLRIMVASNEDWMVPAGEGDRRWFILDVADTYAGTAQRAYYKALYHEIDNGGAAAMFYDLLAMDLTDFDVRAVPHTVAKAQQQAHSLHGTKAWLLHVLQEGKIGSAVWEKTGLTIGKDQAYWCYEEFSKRQREYKPNSKSDWSKKIRQSLGPCLDQSRTGTGNERERKFVFAPLADCRHRFATHIGAPTIEWEPEHGTEEKLDPNGAPKAQLPDHGFRKSEGSPSTPLAQVAALISTGLSDKASESLSRMLAQNAADMAFARNNMR